MCVAESKLSLCRRDATEAAQTATAHAAALQDELETAEAALSHTMLVWEQAETT